MGQAHTRDNSMSANNTSVPLRVPLDLQYSVGNRKLANTLFKSELQQKAKEFKMKKQMDLENIKTQIINKQLRDEKRFAKELKDRNQEIKKRVEEQEAQRYQVQLKKK